jgi:hypothetical protein
MMKSGTYEFVTPSQTTVAPELRPGMRWEHALMEGVRRAGEWPVIRKVVPSNHYSLRVVRSLSEPPNVPAKVDEEASFLGFDDDAPPPEAQGPTDQEQLLFALVRPGATVQRLIDQSYLGEFETCRVLCALVEQGYLEVFFEEHDLSADDADVVMEEEAT